MASFYAQDQAGLDPETSRVWRFLDAQGLSLRPGQPGQNPALTGAGSCRGSGRPWTRCSVTWPEVGLVGHVPAAVGCVVLDVDESDDGGSAVHGRGTRPIWDSPQPPERRPSPVLHDSRVQYSNKRWRHGQAPAGDDPRQPERVRRDLGRRSPWPTCWPAVAMFPDVSPEDLPVSRRGAGR